MLIHASDHYNIIYNAMNTDSARIRPFSGSYLGVVSVQGSDLYNMIKSIYNALNTDSARIRSFFRSLCGRSQCSF